MQKAVLKLLAFRWYDVVHVETSLVYTMSQKCHYFVLP